MEKRRVVITGLGTVNPLGNTAADSWAAAKVGRCGIGPITQFDTTDFKCKLAGEVKNFDPETVVDKKEARKMARFTLLALAAAAEAIADSGLNTEAEAKNIGVVLSSGIGGLPTIEEQHTRGEEKGMSKTDDVQSQHESVNTALKQLRQEERLCRKIAEHSLEVQQHLTESRRDRAAQQQREQERARDLRPDITTR